MKAAFLAFRRSILFLLAIVVPLAAGDRAFAAGGDALTAARFELTIDGHSIAVFTELGSITSAAATSGQPRTATVTLRRAATRNIEMAAWHELVILGDVAAARKSVSLTAYTAQGQPIARYHLTDAWPQKVEIGALKSGASEVLMETVTMTCEFMQRVAI
jgi:phage tail-like protein